MSNPHALFAFALLAAPIPALADLTVTSKPGDEDNHAIFETLGVETIAFSIQADAGEKVTYTLVAENGEGKVIEKISRQEIFYPEPKERANAVFRITRYNPSEVKENVPDTADSPKKWTYQWQGAFGTAGSAWAPEEYTSTIGRDTFADLTKPVLVKTGQSALVWEVRSFPRTFEAYEKNPGAYQFRFRFYISSETPGAGDPTSRGSKRLLLKELPAHLRDLKPASDG